MSALVAVSLSVVSAFHGAPAAMPLIQQSQRARPFMGDKAACEAKLDGGLLRACAVSWAACAAPCLLDPSAVVLDVFGLDVASGLSGVSQPAGGFLQLVAALGSLEVALLVSLASGTSAFDAALRARLTAGTVLAATSTTGTFAAAWATGLAINDPLAVAAVLALSVVTAASALRPVLRESSPSDLVELVGSDARSLFIGDGSADEESPSQRGGSASLLPSFYQSSAVASVIVGAAFMLSPVSPLAVDTAELPATYLARADLGVVFAFVLAPTQFVLLDAVRQGKLAERSTRLLNALTASAIVLLDACGNNQVRMQEVLLRDYAADASTLDTTRFDLNTSATFYAALLVAIVYLVQAVTAQQPEEA